MKSSCCNIISLPTSLRKGVKSHFFIIFSYMRAISNSIILPCRLALRYTQVATSFRMKSFGIIIFTMKSFHYLLVFCFFCKMVRKACWLSEKKRQKSGCSSEKPPVFLFLFSQRNVFLTHMLILYSPQSILPNVKQGAHAFSDLYKTFIRLCKTVFCEKIRSLCPLGKVNNSI